MPEKLKYGVMALLMGFATVVAIMVVFVLVVVLVYGMVIAVQTQPVITVVCGLVLLGVAFSVAYYSKIFK